MTSCVSADARHNRRRCEGGQTWMSQEHDCPKQFKPGLTGGNQGKQRLVRLGAGRRLPLLPPRRSQVRHPSTATLSPYKPPTLSLSHPPLYTSPHRAAVDCCHSITAPLSFSPSTRVEDQSIAPNELRTQSREKKDKDQTNSDANQAGNPSWKQKHARDNAMISPLGNVDERS